MKKATTIARFFLLLLAIPPIIFFTEFKQHFLAHFLGGIGPDMVVGQWQLVAFNVIVFCAFLIPLSYRRRVDWREYGLVSAFFVSLFVEMYGIPLTILFLVRTLHPTYHPLPEQATQASLVAVDLMLNIDCLPPCYLSWLFGVSWLNHAPSLMEIRTFSEPAFDASYRVVI